MYVVTNAQGLTARWIARGATLTHLEVPDRTGALADIVLGFDDLAGYQSERNLHFGCATGRFANRISRGRFTLDGMEYQLATNQGRNHLHGGPDHSLDKVNWQAERLADALGIRFMYVSPDGEESYPGTLSTTITYVLTDDNQLQIQYEATTDRPTIINLTNHSYFNLAGHAVPSILDHVLRIDADRYTVLDDESIPTGELRDVAGTALDFRSPRRIGDRLADLGGGYDHNYVLNGTPGTVREVAEVYEPASGRVMKVLTDQPGMQFYSANGLSGQRGKQNAKYHRHGSLCLETQNFPDAPNHPEFPSAVLRPGETYRHTCIYAFGVSD